MVTGPDEAGEAESPRPYVFVEYDDRYEFLDETGRLLRTMTSAEFNAWKEEGKW